MPLPLGPDALAAAAYDADAAGDAAGDATLTRAGGVGLVSGGDDGAVIGARVTAKDSIIGAAYEVEEDADLDAETVVVQNK